MKKCTFEMELAGKPLIAEFNDLTTHANGSVLLRYGETVILVTAVMSNRENTGQHYFPLSVEFEEKFYAAGQINVAKADRVMKLCSQHGLSTERFGHYLINAFAMTYRLS